MRVLCNLIPLLLKPLPGRADQPATFVAKLEGLVVDKREGDLDRECLRAEPARLDVDKGDCRHDCPRRA
jgi:hypothetical protein